MATYQIDRGLIVCVGDLPASVAFCSLRFVSHHVSFPRFEVLALPPQAPVVCYRPFSIRELNQNVARMVSAFGHRQNLHRLPEPWRFMARKS
jgi:hypothetical protein